MTHSNGNGNGAAIHLSLQGKGGVGKSLAASILAQYFIARGKPVRCVDSDPVNKTLSQYAALQAEPLVKGGMKVDHQGGVKGDHSGEAGYRADAGSYVRLLCNRWCCRNPFFP